MQSPDAPFIFRNWDRSLSCRPRQFLQPDSQDEVAEVVRRAEAAGGTVRAFGAGHSWSPATLCDDTLLNLDQLNRVVQVDAERGQVTVEAGIRLKELIEILPAHGLAMANLGSIAEQSIAGAISTGTHGTGLRHGTLATQVTGLTLVSGGGRVRPISAESQPEMLHAARVSLGALGVITQVTLQCVPAYNLFLHAEARPFDEVLERIDELNQEHERVRLYWFPGTDVIYVMTMNRTDRPVTPHVPIVRWFRNVAIRHDLLAILIRAGKRLPDLVDRINQFSTTVGFVEEQEVARSDQALNIAMPPRHQETEYAVPIERTAEAVRLCRRLIAEKGYRATFPMEIRFVAADEEMLSPAHGRAVCYLGAYTYSEAFAGPYFEGFEAAMKSLQGRPHWGKRHALTAGEARAMYPMFDRFREIRSELDPAGTFANEYIRRLLVD